MDKLKQKIYTKVKTLITDDLSVKNKDEELILKYVELTISISVSLFMRYLFKNYYSIIKQAAQKILDLDNALGHYEGQVYTQFDKVWHKLNELKEELSGYRLK